MLLNQPSVDEFRGRFLVGVQTFQVERRDAAKRQLREETGEIFAVEPRFGRFFSANDFKRSVNFRRSATVARTVENREKTRFFGARVDDFNILERDAAERFVPFRARPQRYSACSRRRFVDNEIRRFSLRRRAFRVGARRRQANVAEDERAASGRFIDQDDAAPVSA